MGFNFVLQGLFLLIIKPMVEEEALTFELLTYVTE
jgi:hypothetical protein